MVIMLKIIDKITNKHILFVLLVQNGSKPFIDKNRTFYLWHPYRYTCIYRSLMLLVSQFYICCTFDVSDFFIIFKVFIVNERYLNIRII